MYSDAPAGVSIDTSRVTVEAPFGPEEQERDSEARSAAIRYESRISVNVVRGSRLVSYLESAGVRMLLLHRDHFDAITNRN